MKHSKHYFTGTRLMLYALFLGMIPTGANAQLFGGMIKPSTNSITLVAPVYCFVGSVYDTDYLPYAASAAPGSTATQAADGIGDTPILNVQGTITTTGITVLMPAITTANGKLKAYTSTMNVPASLTEDGISRDISLTWPEQDYIEDQRYITVRVAAVGGTLNVKKLDINAGNGMNNLGVSLGLLYYPTQPNIPNSPLGVLAVNAVPGIPDKMFGKLDNGGLVRHNFLYLPIYDVMAGVWLDNYLGADYADYSSPYFKLGGHATSNDDYHAYGSLFQWGRKPDGHELITWTSSTVGTGKTGFSSVAVDVPTHDRFISSGSGDWRITSANGLWLANGVNNPCPDGFQVPSYTQFSPYGWYRNVSAYNIDDDCGQMAGGYFRQYNNVPTEQIFPVMQPGGLSTSFWLNNNDAGTPLYMAWGPNAKTTYLTHKDFGFQVRCVKK